MDEFQTQKDKNEYLRQKMKVFKGFSIKLTEDERKRMDSLNTEIAIDNFARSIIGARLDTPNECQEPTAEEHEPAKPAVDHPEPLYVCGDILRDWPGKTERGKAGAVIVCHQVNCKGVMGAGLAKQIREKHPEVYTEYKAKCARASKSSYMLGAVQYCSCVAQSGYTIANIFGQDSYGRTRKYTDYNALGRAFSSIAADYPQSIVRIPYKMGCGLGGGDWDTVQEIIMETLVDKGVYVEIWKKN